MKFNHDHFGIIVDTDSKEIEDKLKILESLYKKIPCTICLFCPKKQSVEADCCKHFSPPMYLIEFINALKIIEKLSENEEKALFFSCYESYLNPSIIRPCVLLKDNLCTVYEKHPFSCFLPKTFVLTRNGGKYIEDVRPGDCVLTIDGSWKMVLKHFEQYYEGPIEKIACRGSIEEFCTSNHKIFSARSSTKRPRLSNRTNWIESKDLIVKKHNRNGDFLYYPKFKFDIVDNNKYINVKDIVGGQTIDGKVYPISLKINSNNLFLQDKKIIGIPENIEINDEFLWIVGIYLAEGSSSQSNTIFSFNSLELNFIERVKNFATAYGVNFTISIDKNRTNVILISSIFAKLMSNLCGQYAKNKKISDIIFNKCNSEMLLKIFDGWNDGDGTKKLSKDLHSLTTTISKFLVLQMYFINLANGKIPFIYYNKSKNRDHGSYSLNIYRHGFQTTIKGVMHKIEENGIFSPLKMKETLPYKGPVINLEIEDNDNYTTSSGLKKNCKMYPSYPKEEWEKRLRTVSAEWEIPIDNIPMKDQCPNVRIEGKIKKISLKEENNIFRDISNIDINLFNDNEFGKEVVHSAATYLPFDAHYLLMKIGPDKLEELSDIRLLLIKENKKNDKNALNKLECEVKGLLNDIKNTIFQNKAE